MELVVRKYLIWIISSFCCTVITLLYCFPITYKAVEKKMSVVLRTVKLQVVQ